MSYLSVPRFVQYPALPKSSITAYLYESVDKISCPPRLGLIVSSFTKANGLKVVSWRLHITKSYFLVTLSQTAYSNLVLFIVARLSNQHAVTVLFYKT